MKLFLICFAAAGLCLMGCGKSKTSTPVATPSSEPAPAAVAEPAPPPSPPSPDAQPTDAPAGETEEPTVAELNKAVNAYIMGQLKEPGTLEELVKAGYVKRLPAAPPGKKFVLNGNKTAVILVNK